MGSPPLVLQPTRFDGQRKRAPCASETLQNLRLLQRNLQSMRLPLGGGSCERPCPSKEEQNLAPEELLSYSKQFFNNYLGFACVAKELEEDLRQEGLRRMDKLGQILSCFSDSVIKKSEGLAPVWDWDTKVLTKELKSLLRSSGKREREDVIAQNPGFDPCFMKV